MLRRLAGEARIAASRERRPLCLGLGEAGPSTCRLHCVSGSTSTRGATASRCATAPRLPALRHATFVSSTHRSFSTTSANAKGKQREDEDASADAEHDVAIALLEMLMDKRKLLRSKRDSANAPDAALAKEIGDLERLHSFREEYRSMQQNLESLLKMTTREAEPDDEMRALAVEEAEAALASLDTLKLKIRRALVPTEEVDDQDAIVEVRMGVGGGESALFVATIARMYLRFLQRGLYEDADERGSGTGSNEEDMGRQPYSFEVEELSNIPADGLSGHINTEAFREVIISVKGKGAYGLLRNEAGVHRVQRIPATQNTGKIQTSTIAVLVLPAGGREGNSRSDSAESTRDDVVDPKDVRVEVMRAQGAGGQHVNKTESAVRLTHEPTGISVSMQDTRSQHQNRARAWVILRARLLDRKLRAEAEEKRNVRRAQIGSMERHERIRTYNFPQGRVTDHRISLTVKSFTAILEGKGRLAGGLGYLVDELLEHRDTLALADRKEQVKLELSELRAQVDAR